jgi:SAM-dependent methyltransferase
MSSSVADYVLGSSDWEHERLMRQARTLKPLTDRLLRDAGVASARRVLDIGAGVGDVSLAVAQLVGERGFVCGIDQDTAALAKARIRAQAASLDNVRFLVRDIRELNVAEDFDAIVARFVWMFMPAAHRPRILASLAQRLNPGGVLVFQEPSWRDFFANTPHLPLHAACGRLVCDALVRSGAEVNMAWPLYRCLIESGLHVTTVRIEVPLATLDEDLDWIADLFVTLQSAMERHGIERSAVGPLIDLSLRLRHELLMNQSFAPFMGVVGTIAQKPT